VGVRVVKEERKPYVFQVGCTKKKIAGPGRDGKFSSLAGKKGPTVGPTQTTPVWGRFSAGTGKVDDNTLDSDQASTQEDTPHPQWERGRGWWRGRIR